MAKVSIAQLPAILHYSSKLTVKWAPVPGAKWFQLRGRKEICFNETAEAKRERFWAKLINYATGKYCDQNKVTRRLETFPTWNEEREQGGPQRRQTSHVLRINQVWHGEQQITLMASFSSCGHFFSASSVHIRSGRVNWRRKSSFAGADGD